MLPDVLSGTLNIDLFSSCLCCSEESYNVTDYALREQLAVQPCAEDAALAPARNAPALSPVRNAAALAPALAPAALSSATRQGQNTAQLFRLLVRSNHAGDSVELLLGTDTQ